MTTVQHHVSGSKGRFILTSGSDEAFMSYSILNERTRIIDATLVPDTIRGTGAGKTLLAQLVQDAREKNYNIVPLCPFVKATLMKTPEWQNIIQS